jgi:hypothetical protein
MKKLIDTNKKKEHESDIIMHNENDNDIEIECGPWYDDPEEAKKDEELFHRDKEAFFKKIKKG